MDLTLLTFTFAVLLLLLVVAAVVLARRSHGGHLAYRFGPEHKRRMTRR